MTEGYILLNELGQRLMSNGYWTGTGTGYVFSNEEIRKVMKDSHRMPFKPTHKQRAQCQNFRVTTIGEPIPIQTKTPT